MDGCSLGCRHTEIDHNFSQAHRIVTTSILPLVEQYTEHSRDVWDGAKVSFTFGYDTCPMDNQVD